MGRSPTHVRPAGRGAPPAVGAKYRLCARLGRGGQAEVFLALAPGPLGSHELVALKRLPPEAPEQPELVAMFLDEARLAARLNHPNVVRTYEVGAGDDDCFIAMELLEGQPLGRVRARAGATFGPATWARVAADALAGLDYAHELCDYDGTPLGIVHRDVSPHNLFVTYEGAIKLVDFGVAKTALNRVRTEAGIIKGKAGYMAPEQVLGLADRRADVYALGVVLWEMLAGRRLYAGELYKVLHRVLHEPVPRVSSVAPEVDPELDAIVARAVEKKPDDRYPTARAMREALEGYLAARGPGAHAADLGRWLQSAFAEEREQLRRQVERACGSGVGPCGGAPELAPAGGPPASGRTGGLGSTLLEAPGAPTPLSHSHLGVIVGAQDGGAPRRPSALAPALAALGVLGMVAAGTMVARARFAAPPAITSAALAVAPAPPAASPDPAPSGRLAVASEPTRALVSLNGKPLGVTPLELALPAGVHTLLLSKQGYQTEALVADVPAAGALAPPALSLRPAARAAPADATPPRPAHARPAPGARSAEHVAPAAPAPAASAAPLATASSRLRVRLVDEGRPGAIDIID
ncbi:MAG TPA: serine/threonine-protein kinase [Polyangiaceae bacterium]|nr:serine/threonine-protein kinase [Polyangiaceae bacterium]